MRDALLRAYDLYCRGALFVVAVTLALAALLAVVEIGGLILWFLSFVSLPVSFWLLARKHRREPFADRGALIALGALLLLLFVIHQFLWQRELIGRFGLVRMLVNDGEYHRLFTAGFLHKNLGHLFFNSLGLFLSFPFVARYLGTPRALAVFLLSIPGCAVVSAFFAPPLSLSLGASGGLLGLDGALLVILARPALRDSMSEEELLYAFSLLPSCLGAAFYPGPMVDGPGHLGGLGAGILLGFVFTSGRLPGPARWAGAIAGTTLAVGALTLLLLPRPEFARQDELAWMIGLERYPAYREYWKQRKEFLEKLPTVTRVAPPDPKLLHWLRGDFERATRAWKDSLEEASQKSEPFAGVRWRMHMEVSQLLETQQNLVFDRAFEKPGWAEQAVAAARKAEAEIETEVRRNAADLRPSR